MASSKVMVTTSTTNSDPPRQHSLCSSLSSLLADLQDQNQNQNPLSSTSTTAMDDLLKNVYSFPTESEAPSPLPLPGGSSKSVDEVWKEIVSGSDEKGITLEDFLTKAGAVREEDVRVPVQVDMSVEAYGAVDTKIDNHHHGGGGGGGGGKGRHKRRAVEEPPMDKATQQKQKRMIKNRESAARSRERKQAYTIELEFLVTQLEEENARLLREKVEKDKERFKALMENLIPVVEKRRPPRVCVLRRVNSVQW